MSDIRHKLKNPELDKQGEEIAQAFRKAGYEVDKGVQHWNVLHNNPDVPPDPTFYYDFDLKTWRGYALAYSDSLGVTLPNFLDREEQPPHEA